MDQEYTFIQRCILVALLLVFSRFVTQENNKRWNNVVVVIGTKTFGGRKPKDVACKTRRAGAHTLKWYTKVWINSIYLYLQHEHESLSSFIPFHHRCIPGWTRKVWLCLCAQQGSSFVDETGRRRESSVSIHWYMLCRFICTVVCCDDSISCITNRLTIKLLLPASCVFNIHRCDSSSSSSSSSIWTSLELQVFQVKVLKVVQLL